MGWRDITNATNERTVIASVLPLAGVGNKIPLFMMDSQKVEPKHAAAALLGNLTALVFDFVARQKIGAPCCCRWTTCWPLPKNSSAPVSLALD
jgi:predicted small lipoprotein YifL